jgi:hypothetical protein
LLGYLNARRGIWRRFEHKNRAAGHICSQIKQKGEAARRRLAFPVREKFFLNLPQDWTNQTGEGFTHGTAKHLDPAVGLPELRVGTAPGRGHLWLQQQRRDRLR